MTLSALWAIASREFASFFRTPLGWVVVALFVCLSSVFFVGRTLVPGNPATLRDFFGVWWGLLLVLTPAVSMRLFSEEARTGTIESVLTAPTPEWAVVAGKFLAGTMFLLAMLAPTLAYAGLLAALSRPDYGPIAAAYLGITLLGMLYLAVGVLVSVLTSSQTLAFLGTLFALLMIDMVVVRVAAQAPPGLAAALFSLSPSVRAADFSRGLVDSAHVVFFLAGSFLMLAAATVVLQSRRWR
jgi:ABC-2 type transport system permease protein